ncbi:MAG: 50S ribosomal protein L25 [Anaerolineae bacterium]|nr:50S ribosomal protein L25 [Anaerolineae bacterium]
MAQQYTLEAQPRTIIGKKVRFLRRQDLIPAVIYGVGGEPVHISCPRRPLEIVLGHAGGTHIINVSVDGASHATIVREVQRDVIRRSDIMHVDFLRVDLTKTMRTEVPIVLVGAPKLANELQLQQNITSIEVECLPTSIPEHIEVNIANLTTAGAHITVSDLPALDGVQLLADPTEVIVRIATLAAQTEEEETTEAVVAEPEVVERGKKEEEEF